VCPKNNLPVLSAAAVALSISLLIFRSSMNLKRGSASRFLGGMPAGEQKLNPRKIRKFAERVITQRQWRQEVGNDE
jgi:hypothetical protein